MAKEAEAARDARAKVIFLMDMFNVFESIKMNILYSQPLKTSNVSSSSSGLTHLVQNCQNKNNSSLNGMHFQSNYDQRCTDVKSVRKERLLYESGQKIKNPHSEHFFIFNPFSNLNTSPCWYSGDCS